MAEDADLHPEAPDEEGLPTQEPRAMQVEAAHLLANDARDQLRSQGFDDLQIDEWADTYVASVGAGDVDDFIGWIGRQQH